jgi:hypothetical protein
MNELCAQLYRQWRSAVMQRENSPADPLTGFQ